MPPTSEQGVKSIEMAEKVVKGELANKDKQLELVDGLLEEVTLG